MRSSPTQVVAPDVSEASDYVLPKPKRGAGDVVVVAGRSGAHSKHRRSSEVAKRLGQRFVLLAECQEQFLIDLREGLEALDEAVAEDARVRLKGAVQSALGVLDWCEAVQRDLQHEGSLAAIGWEPIDLAEFCRDFANEGVVGVGAMTVEGSAAQPWWGDAAKLHDALHAGVLVVAERTAGLGAIRVEVGCDAGRHRLCIAGTGEPREDLDAGAVRTFRQAVERLGARVVPDALGPGGAGLVLELPEQAS